MDAILALQKLGDVFFCLLLDTPIPTSKWDLGFVLCGGGSTVQVLGMGSTLAPPSPGLDL